MGASLFNSAQPLETRVTVELSHHCSLSVSVLGYFISPPPPLTVCMEKKKKMIHRDIEAICNILYGLSEESLLLCFPEIFFFSCIVHRNHTVYPHPSLYPCVCV